ncbi:MAG: helix-turn-helix transcriptional regulator [Deltaproteobacteria bacterium]|nr:helix-turn-helix transcriptional regulator [Deltaproteobacteria bacterium]
MAGTLDENLSKLLKTGLSPKAKLAQKICQELLSEEKDFNVKAIAEQNEMSVRSLQRLFRTYVGLTPKWVLQRRRLQKAAVALDEENVSPAELAADLGYADQAHLARDFKESTACLPLLMRRKVGTTAKKVRSTRG